VGTLEGAPIPLSGGGFKKSAGGGLEMARLDLKGLWSLAQAGGGIYRTLDEEGHRDIEAILEFLDRKPETTDNAGDPVEVNQWRESGVLLLPVMLFLAGLLFRRGWLFSLSWLLLLPIQSPPRADEGSGTLWLTPDQAGSRDFQDGNYESAKARFQNSDWKAAAAYKAGDYASALKALEEAKEAARDYNRGNALAMQGNYAEALKAYDEQLKKTPGDEDTLFNRKLVEDALKKQQEQPQKPKDDQQSGNDGDKNQKKNQKQDPQGKDEAKQDSDQEPGQNSPKNQDPKANQDQSAKNPPNDSKDSGQKPPPSNDSKDAKNPDPKPDDGKSSGQDEGAPKGDPPPPAGADGKNEQGVPPEKPQASVNPQDKPPADELDQSSAQWLRRIPDDPGGLLRRKFLYQSQQRQQQR
jgi:Ca-activated chloride channel family protein